MYYDVHYFEKNLIFDIIRKIYFFSQIKNYNHYDQAFIKRKLIPLFFSADFMII